MKCGGWLSVDDVPCSDLNGTPLAGDRQAPYVRDHLEVHYVGKLNSTEPIKSAPLGSYTLTRPPSKDFASNSTIMRPRSSLLFALSLRPITHPLPRLGHILLAFIHMVTVSLHPASSFFHSSEDDRIRKHGSFICCFRLTPLSPRSMTRYNSG